MKRAGVSSWSLLDWVRADLAVSLLGDDAGCASDCLGWASVARRRDARRALRVAHGRRHEQRTASRRHGAARCNDDGRRQRLHHARARARSRHARLLRSLRVDERDGGRHAADSVASRFVRPWPRSALRVLRRSRRASRDRHRCENIHAVPEHSLRRLFARRRRKLRAGAAGSLGRF